MPDVLLTVCALLPKEPDALLIGLQNNASYFKQTKQLLFSVHITNRHLSNILTTVKSTEATERAPSNTECNRHNQYSTLHSALSSDIDNQHYTTHYLKRCKHTSATCKCINTTSTHLNHLTLRVAFFCPPVTSKLMLFRIRKTV